MFLQFPAIKLDPPARPKFIRALDTLLSSEFRSPIVENARLPSLDATQQPVIAVNAHIAASFSAVDWGDDVDYGPEFTAPTPELRNIAKAFVEGLAHAAIKRFGRPIPIPEVSPAADGSIDLHWGDGEARELLLGIRKAGNLASYFGRDRGGDNIKGTLQIDQQNEFLASWLMSHPV